MYLDKTNTLHIKIKNKEELNKTVTELPKEILNVYYSKIDDETYELAAISKQNSLYYARININSKDSNKFQEIGQNVQDVYKTTYDKENVYVYETKNFKTNFIIAKENKTLEYITYSKNKYETHKSLNEERPYFNYICALEENDICKNTIVYQTFDDNIMLGYNKGKTIRDELKKEIVVKEMFSVLKLKKDTELTSLTYKKLNKKTDYLYTIYIVDKEDELYKIEINSNVIKSKEIPTALKNADKKVKQIKYHQIMLSNKVIDYLNKQGVYSEKEDKAYKKALIDLGIDLNSDFALFNLNTTEITFRGQCGEIYNVCWFKIYSNDLSYGIERQAVLGIPSEYLPLDSFEGEGGFFYNRNTGEVLEIELGEKLINFQNGKLSPQWKDFNSFLEWYFGL